ncbi:MAG: AAA family ATPase [Deltaproteobacteria bacterium]|nr:AAA family ATPase [Deltaproteobacteria bacterium]
MKKKGGNPKVVPKFVLTGGPCSGKTSSMAYLAQKLSEYGFMVFVIPETATLITNCGIDRRRMENPIQVIGYEEAILDLQLFLEDKIERSINAIFSRVDPVILLDRGIMDVKAFIPEGYEREFEKMLKKRNMDLESARDRYTGVIHLVTCAEGNEEYYTLEGNSARIETPEEARKLDYKIRQAWLGHPNLSIIGNEADFNKKIKKAFASISKMLGIPVPKEMTRKYLVDLVESRNIPKHEKIEIEEFYLQVRKRSEEIKLKRRRQRGSFMYFVSRRYPVQSHGTWVEIEQMIDEQEYQRLLKMRDRSRIPIKKLRHCLIWENQYLKLDFYSEPFSGLKILNIDLTEENQTISLPNFIKVREDITFNEMYEERNLSLKRQRLF